MVSNQLQSSTMVEDKVPRGSSFRSYICVHGDTSVDLSLTKPFLFGFPKVESNALSEVVLSNRL